MKKLRYMIEAAFLSAAFYFFRLLPPEKASELGGSLGRYIGPILGASKKALFNIRHAFPEKGPTEHQKILTDMWDNLGRVIAEYPHMHRLALLNMEIEGEEYVRGLDPDLPAIFVGAHLANWELMPAYFNTRIKLPMTSTYRAPNNPYVARILEKCRDPFGKNIYIPKSARGAKEMVLAMKKNARLGILIDQKYNQGVPAKFFGRYAMTSTAFVQLARKFSCPIIPMQIVRTGSCQFRFSLHTPIFVGDQSDEYIINIVHNIIEDWIREAPGQWLWLHRRWDSKAVKEMNAAL
jgi:KDO2-lipid IV(A) lauroyltransferase